MGFLARVLKLLAVMKEFTFSEYSLEYIITMVFPLSACVTIAFSIANVCQVPSPHISVFFAIR